MTNHIILSLNGQVVYILKFVDCFYLFACQCVFMVVLAVTTPFHNLKRGFPATNESYQICPEITYVMLIAESLRNVGEKGKPFSF